MNKHFHKVIFLSIAGWCMIMWFGCQTPKPEEKSTSIIRSDHLDHLYDEMVVEGDTIGFVHIYSEYPDYHMVGDDDEGMACVDDVARAAVFYAKQYRFDHQPEHLRKLKMLARFLVRMQAPNGYSYNFIWPNGEIHKDGITSKPIPVWWSWRALWAYSEILQTFDESISEEALRSTISSQRMNMVHAILREPSFRNTATDTSGGRTIPTWLPEGSAADQAGVMVLGLVPALLDARKSGDKDVMFADSIAEFLNHLGEGIVMMQLHEPDSLFHGAMLSAFNVWHAYGNIQSYALLMLGEVLNREGFGKMALLEIHNFFPAFLKAGGIDHFFVRKQDDHLLRYDSKTFPQIAYGRRPMIWACLEAYHQTGDSHYFQQASALGDWFFGKNAPQVNMYDLATGRGYDGINDAEHYNQNAGAESTIEALLSIQALEQAGGCYDEHSGTFISCQHKN